MTDVCVRTVRDHLVSENRDDHSPVTSTAKSPYLPLTPDTPTSSGFNSPVSVSASDIQRHGSSVNSLPSVGVDDKRKPCLSSPSPPGHTRHRSVDFALAEIVPDLSETIDTDFVHAARSCDLLHLFHCFETLLQLRKSICCL